MFGATFPEEVLDAAEEFDKPVHIVGDDMSEIPEINQYAIQVGQDEQTIGTRKNHQQYGRGGPDANLITRRMMIRKFDQS